jgi:hypothetical protein
MTARIASEIDGFGYQSVASISRTSSRRSQISIGNLTAPFRRAGVAFFWGVDVFFVFVFVFVFGMRTLGAIFCRLSRSGCLGDRFNAHAASRASSRRWSQAVRLFLWMMGSALSTWIRIVIL